MGGHSAPHRTLETAKGAAMDEVKAFIYTLHAATAGRDALSEQIYSDSLQKYILRICTNIFWGQSPSLCDGKSRSACPAASTWEIGKGNLKQILEWISLRLVVYLQKVCLHLFELDEENDAEEDESDDDHSESNYHWCAW